MYRLIILLALVASLPFTGNAQRKRALLVGISSYKTNGYRVWDNIHGAEDVRLLTPELEKKGFAVEALVNEAATYDGIVGTLSRFIATSKRGDVAFIHFSCHGQPVEDGLKGDTIDEADHWDEAIVPIDAGDEYAANGYRGESHFTDDELNHHLTRLRERIGPKGMLYVAMDACHAGTMWRKGQETKRGTKEGLTKSGAKYNPPMTNIRHYAIAQSPRMSPVLFIEACQSRERNTEITVNGEEYGPLSYNVCQALRAMADLGLNALELKDKVEESKNQKGRWPKHQTLVFEY